MKKQIVLVLLLLLVVDVVSAAASLSEGHGKIVTSPKFVVHWLPLPFDGTNATCKFGLVQHNWRGDAVCTRKRGGNGLSVDVSTGETITLELPPPMNESNSTGTNETI